MKISKVVVMLWILTCSLFGLQAKSAPLDKAAGAKSSSKASGIRSSKNAEDIFRLTVFLERDNPLAAGAALDQCQNIFSDAQSKEKYFYELDSFITPVATSDDDIHAFDLDKLNRALELYAIRNWQKHDPDQYFQTQYALQALVGVLSRTTELSPPKTIVIDGASSVGAKKYFYVILPWYSGLRSIKSVLDTIIATDNASSFPLAIKRIADIQQIIKKFAVQQRVFSKKRGWRESNVETADTRAYAKLFKEELPILRRELILLKADIDKGFTALQKQQDAKTKASAKPVK